MQRDSGLVPDRFRSVEQLSLGEKVLVSDWLRARPVKPETVLLSWDQETAAQAPWSLVVSHWDDFWYPSTDDLSVVDMPISFVLLFMHFERVDFGVVASAP